MQDWTIHGEYVDSAPANDFGHQTEWRRLLDDSSKKKFRAVLVFKLDRAFRSVKHIHDTLEIWELTGVVFISLREQFDTSTALGRLLLTLLAALAEFELELIRERVKAGMDRARRQGKRIGRPSVMDQRGLNVVLEQFWSESTQAKYLDVRQQKSSESATRPSNGP